MIKLKAIIITDPWVVEYDGEYYVESSLATNLMRYKNSFGNIVLSSRCRRVDILAPMYVPLMPIVDEFLPVTGILDSLSLKNYKRILNIIKKCDLLIARVPSLYAFRIVDMSKKVGIPYMVECMGCAWDAYWNHGIIGKIIAPYVYYKMKNSVRVANYATYVTEKYLQSKYPCNNIGIAASDVRFALFNNDDIIDKRIKRIENLEKSTPKLLTAAAVDVRYKGHEYVIKALPILDKMGIYAEYHIAGKGDQSFLRNLVKKYNVEKQVIFHGALSQEELLNLEDDIDIYIQPSKQEGLPRAMVEAMSRGCPCLGAKTAGIPELIDEECVFARGSVNAVVIAIKQMLNYDMREYAVRNYKKSQTYREDILDEKRNAYYKRIMRELNREC